MPKRSRPNEENGAPTRAADKSSWTRIMNKRRQDFHQLSASKIQSMLARVPQTINSSSSMDLDGMSPPEILEERLWEHMEIAGDATQPPSQRRDSWAVVAATFSQVDVELNRTPMHPQSTIATARSVFDRINLSATTSAVPAGSRIAPPAVATQPPLMRQQQTGNGIVTSALGSTVLPIHPLMSGRMSSTLSTGAAPSTTTTTATTAAATTTATAIPPPQGTSVVAGLALHNTTTETTMIAGTSGIGTTTAAPIVAATTTTTTTTTPTRRPSVTTTTASTAARLIGIGNTTAANGSVPIHPSMIRGSASTATTVPVHPSMRRTNLSSNNNNNNNNNSSSSSSSTGKAAAALALDAALKNMATAATATTATTTTTTMNAPLPIHPSLQRVSSGTTEVAPPAARAASVIATGTSTGNLPVHPTTTGNLPVHPAMHGENASSTTSTGARTTTKTLTGASPPPPSPTSITTTTAATTGSTNRHGSASTTLGTNGQSFVSVDKARTTQAGSAAVLVPSLPVVSRPTNPTHSSGSSGTPRTAGNQATTNNSNSASSGSSSSSAAGQTRPNASQPPAAQPPANQGASSSTAAGGQTTTSSRPTASKSTTAMANGTTATNSKFISAASRPTALANGSTTTNRIAASGAAAEKSATKAGQKGTSVPNGAGDKPKENRKPAATTKPKKNRATLPPVKLVVSEKISLVVLPPDSGTGSLTGCCDPRPKCVVKYHRYSSVPGIDTVSKRLASTEPYWHLVKAIGSGMTAMADRLEWPAGRGRGMNVPKTVWSMTLLSHNMKEIANKVKKWGEPSNNPENLECRLFLRMLPVNITEKMKAKRADCHLWPKGTMLVVDGKPQELSQRKQQSHAKEEWKGMCKHFDLSSIIENSLDSHTIQICSTDILPYWVSIGLCQYRPPEFHVRKLLGMEPESSSNPKNHRLQRLSLEASKKKLKQFLDQPAIVLDDDDDVNEIKSDGGGGVGKIVCPLVDSHSMAVIKTAVRGKKCKHFSCFDLETFMIESRVVSGTRWRCHCCETFLKYHELQSCALTQQVLDKFKDQVTAIRKRVEFRADETYELLPEDNRLRYSTVSTKQAPGEPRGRPPQQEDEIIDLVDSD
ncbi:MAG: hypothetical protein SGBAC_006534 [Bacillariaceae sp.]